MGTASTQKIASGAGPDVPAVLAALRARADPATLAGMARYALPSHHALGVPMKEIKALGKQLGRQHALAQGKKAVAPWPCAPSSPSGRA